MATTPRELHAALDLLLAQYLKDHREALPGSTSVLDLLEWDAARIELVCTGVAAVWCPLCGDCSCERQSTGERVEDSEACPLHAPSSQHGEAIS